MFKNFLIAAWAFIKKFKWFVAAGLVLVAGGIVTTVIVINNNHTAIPVSNTVSNVSSSSSEVSSAASSEVTSSPEASSSSEVSSSSEATSSAAHKHKWVKQKTVAPTTSSKGYTLYKCSCGETKKDDWKAKLTNKIDIPKPETKPVSSSTGNNNQKIPDGRYYYSGVDQAGNTYYCTLVQNKGIGFYVLDYREEHDDLSTLLTGEGFDIAYFNNSFTMSYPSAGNNVAICVIYPDGEYDTTEDKIDY